MENMITVAANLNELGQAHVAAELERLNLCWDVSATCSEIEGMSDFRIDGCSYEVSPCVFIEVDSSMIDTVEIEA